MKWIGMMRYISIPVNKAVRKTGILVRKANILVRQTGTCMHASENDKYIGEIYQ